jgi:hypothetical protein
MEACLDGWKNFIDELKAKQTLATRNGPGKGSSKKEGGREGRSVDAVLRSLPFLARNSPGVRPLAETVSKGIRSIEKKRAVLEFFGGELRSRFPKNRSGLLVLPKSDLVEETRRFWFGNVSGAMEVAGERIDRRAIYVHGGPDPRLTHPVSQRLEWLSRIKQTNLFEPHSSPQEELCRLLCSRQGDELWAPLHQNFDFAVGCDPKLPAPKCLFILHAIPTRRWPYMTYHRFLSPGNDQWLLMQKRRLARSCQTDLTTTHEGVDWAKYDLVFMVHTARNRKFKRPDIPVLLYGHEIHPDDSGYQWVLDRLQPDVLLTGYWNAWNRYVRLPARTKLVLAPFAPSMFYSRPNTDPRRKSFDLLSIGMTAGDVYTPRRELDRQLRALPSRFNVAFSHAAGVRRFSTDGRTLLEGPEGPIRFLNQWSAFLGTARFVIFGRIAGDVHNYLVGKYYETLACGAIPIFPDIPDLVNLGVRPYEHYIPLSDVEGDNRKLIHLLDHYEEYRPVAVNAVQWAEENMDRMLFDDFENIVHEVTGGRYPRRLIDQG